MYSLQCLGFVRSVSIENSRERCTLREEFHSGELALEAVIVAS